MISRVREWFNGGDPRGREKIRAWATGDDGRSRGYTRSVGVHVTWLMVLACVLYPLTKGIGSIFVLVLAIFLMGGRAFIENQVRRDFSDLNEARRQYERTRNPEYLEFMVLRAEGMLEDNKILTDSSRQALEEHAEWARKRQERAARKDGSRKDGSSKNGSRTDKSGEEK
ncbi:hypothetical protein ACSL103130_09590 [Actinomyces slackii]|uniref:Uncharacterized protein n=1 Tax=Actinomyces slackii TaxID=52774 RepID=A0A448K9L5_9ACTO|nr:hypothetical protein [Actinomyces slackii]VEG73594.1 Uncharacterised protein [Actinomyces slackii]